MASSAQNKPITTIAMVPINNKYSLTSSSLKDSFMMNIKQTIIGINPKNCIFIFI